MRSQKFFVMLIVALAHTLKSQSYLHRNLQRRAFNPKLYSGLESVKQIEKPLKNGISVKDASMSTVELGTSSRLRTGSSIVNPEMTDIKDFQSFKTSSSLTGEGYPVQQTHDKVFPKKGEDIDFSVEYGRSSKNLGGIETGSDSIKMSTKNLAGQEKTDNIYKTKSTFTSYDSKIMRKPSDKMKNIKTKFHNYISKMTSFFKSFKAKPPRTPPPRQPSPLENIVSLWSDTVLRNMQSATKK